MNHTSSHLDPHAPYLAAHQQPLCYSHPQVEEYEEQSLDPDTDDAMEAKTPNPSATSNNLSGSFQANLSLDQLLEFLKRNNISPAFLQSAVAQSSQQDSRAESA